MADRERTDAADRATVVERQRSEWDRHQRLMDEALGGGDPETAKLAKLLAEALKIRQEGERRAWGITDKADTELSGGVDIAWRN